MDSEKSDQRPAQGPAERLLDAADKLFYEKGYAGTGVNELMKEAGAAKASFYHHFPSKNDLILAFLDHRFDSWFEGLSQEVDQHTDPARRVTALFDYLEKWMVSCDFRGCAFLNTVSEFPDPASQPRGRVRDAKKALREYIGRLCSDAGREELGDEIFLLFEGATSQTSVVGEVWPVKAARDAIQKKFTPTSITTF